MTARVLIAHAYYRQRGGEDIVAEQEAELLERNGVAVARYTVDNAAIDESHRMSTAVNTLWSRRTTRDLERLLRAFRPDVVHVHNTFPSLSPSLYWMAARCRIPVVQTLHNFRLLCPQAMLLRNGAVCEDCVGRAPWRAVVHRCYRESVTQSAVVAAMLSLHRALGTYRHWVTRYIALNEFCRRKFIAGGLPADKIAVKSNFAAMSAPESDAPRAGALFAGRIAIEKGARILSDALTRLPNWRLDLVGDGPDADRIGAHANSRMLGWLEPEDLFAIMRRKAYLVLPSIWYENAPRVLIEAFGCGLPVIASRLGALTELVAHGDTGLLFDPQSPDALIDTIGWAEDHPDALREMGGRARRVYESRYTPERNYRDLIAIYRQAVATLTAEHAA